MSDIEIRHPKTTNTKAFWVAKIEGPPRCKPKNISENGRSKQEWKEVLSRWNNDGERYCDMDYSHNTNDYLPKTLLNDEDKDRYKILILGKEVDSKYYKCAIEDKHNGNIILRSFTFAVPWDLSKLKESQEEGWYVDFSRLSADSTFWTKFKEFLN